MLDTSSRLHTFVYATLLSIVLVCASVHLAAYVSNFIDPNNTSGLIIVSTIVSAMLAPLGSFMFATYSFKLIRVQEELRKLATTDPLTGLYNRRAFEDIYAREGARCLRTGQSVSLILLDMDFFKQVNIDHGHVGGDYALQQMAECLKSSLRFGMDEIARWGGEEFLVMLTDTGRETAIRAALRFRQRIQSLEVTHGEKQIRLTASFGIVTCLKDESLEDAVIRADQCMRQAKKQGRNKVVAYPHVLPPRPRKTAA